jgi:hypothetical protein
MLGCKMFPHFCRKFLDDIRFRHLYLQGRGPTQITGQDRKVTTTVVPQKGPGTELLKMLNPPKMLKAPLKLLGFVLRVKNIECAGSCIAYARKMNAWGVAGCRERIEEIADHLEAQAKKLTMPFNRRVAKVLVRLAIRRAEVRTE